MMRRTLALFCLFALSACAITPKQGPSCGFVRHVIDVDTPTTVTTSAAVEGHADPSIKALQVALTPRPTTVSSRPVDLSMLFLSGGSLHGALGAGYLQGWKAQSGHLPNFAVVTGISTGAILATFAFIDRPEIARKAYAIPVGCRPVQVVPRSLRQLPLALLLT